jgi:bacteriorhodopsin
LVRYAITSTLQASSRDVDKMGNDALRVNGFSNTVTVNNHITVRGSDWYWAVCAVMLASTGVFMGLAFTKPR